jgi:hypothetical protein
MEEIDKGHQQQHAAEKKIPGIPGLLKGIIGDAEDANGNDDA